MLFWSKNTLILSTAQQCKSSSIYIAIVINFAKYTSTFAQLRINNNNFFTQPLNYWVLSLYNTLKEHRNLPNKVVKYITTNKRASFYIVINFTNIYIMCNLNVKKITKNEWKRQKRIALKAELNCIFAKTNLITTILYWNTVN